MSLKLKILKAFHGDCIILNFGEAGNRKNILIDGGIRRTYPRELRSEIETIFNRGENIDLLIITHIDDDHIGGVIELFRDPSIDKEKIKKVWFNSESLLSHHLPELLTQPNSITIEPIETEMSIRQGYTLESILKQLGSWEQTLVSFNPNFMEIDFHGASISVLSPRIDGLSQLSKIWKRDDDESTKMSSLPTDYQYKITELLSREFEEDDSVTNKSSISFLFEINGKKVLLLGDSHPSDIIKSLEEMGYNESNKLVVDYVKISHHGSKKNTSPKLLQVISCNNFIITTDGTKHSLPNKECLSRIISEKSGVKLVFNYDIHRNIFSSDEEMEYNFTCHNFNELEV